MRVLHICYQPWQLAGTQAQLSRLELTSGGPDLPPMSSEFKQGLGATSADVAEVWLAWRDVSEVQRFDERARDELNWHEVAHLQSGAHWKIAAVLGGLPQRGPEACRRFTLAEHLEYAQDLQTQLQIAC